jgi:hypothetical protein
MAHTLRDANPVIDEDESTTQIPAGLVKALIAEDDPTAKIPAALVQSLMAREGIALWAACWQPSAVVPPPTRTRRIQPRPRSVTEVEKPFLSAFDRAWDEIAQGSA